MSNKVISGKIDYSNNSKLVQDFLDNYSSENTKISYSSMLNHYFNFLKIEPDSYFEDSQDFNKDVKSYAIEINSLAPKTQKARLACIKMFLLECDIELKHKVWRNINRRRNGNHAITQDITPTPGQLKKILQFGTIKSRALFLVLSSGRMRVEEALNITWNNIDFEKDPVIIRIPAFTKDRKKLTKNGKPRITFISNEAKEAILEWKKVRNEYLEKAVEKTTVAVKKYYKDARIPTDNERIFPFHYSTALQCWKNMIERAGKPFNEKDTQTNRYKYHIHTLRKFFRTQLSLGVGNPDIAEVLMGHEGYLTSSYRHISEEELAKQYKEGMNRLLVYTDFETIKSYTSKLEEQIHSTNTTLATQDFKLRSIEEMYGTRLKRQQKKFDFITEEMIKLKTQLRDITFRQDEREAEEEYEKRKMEINEMQNQEWIVKSNLDRAKKKKMLKLKI